MQTVSAHDIADLVRRAMLRAGFAAPVADIMAQATAEAEVHGKPRVGLDHVFYYLQAAKNGLINKTPEPVHSAPAASLIVVNADHGPMQYAYHHGETALINAAQEHGMAALLINAAFAGGELGYYSRRLAGHSLISLAMANSPAVMSVGGSSDRLVGTNPLSYGIPLKNHRAMIIDQASSSTARVNIQKYADHGESLPHGWALNRRGQPTTDPTAALAGTLLPFGGYKGSNIAMLVEFLAMLGGGDSSFEAGPYFTGERRQGIGATIIAIDATKFPGYTARIDGLITQFTRDHGSKIRVTNLEPKPHKLEVPAILWSQLQSFAKNGPTPEA